MKHRARRSSFTEDCLLAGFVSVIAYVAILLLGGTFPWSSLLALLIVPIAFLATYRRFRAASLCAAAGAIAGAWDIVPPARSFALDANGIAALITFAAAALITIALPALASRAPQSNA